MWSWRTAGCLAGLLLASAQSATAEPTAADYFVHSLPDAPDGPLLKMHAGHIEVTPEHHGNMFFWLFKNRHIANKQRTVIWLNGGPGCSSMDGALMEIGPYRVQPNGTLRYNEGSWDEFANVVFVDNPVGTGYSYVDTDSYVTELETMADQMVQFIEKFFALFPEYEHDDLYLAGESYAGTHIPYIAKAILKHNEEQILHPWALKGLIIGNGWMSPVDQYPAYLDFAHMTGLIPEGSPADDELQQVLAICQASLKKYGSDQIDYSGCEQILNDMLRLTQDTSTPADSMERCVNMYDIRLRDSYSSCGMNWPPDLEDVTPYLRRPEVRSALNVNSDKVTGWVECKGSVGSALRQSKAHASVTLLPDLLSKMKIVLFSGDKDLICNHVGTEEMINRMEWNGGRGFEISPGVWAPRKHWTVEDEPAGIWQEARNLTYVLFYNSSHMVPFDYPRRTRDMLDRVIGVDIGSIGGSPANSRLDGEKGLETSVGGHPNSTQAEKEEQNRLQEAAWNAYYKSGEVALVVVIIVAGLFAYCVWRGRRRAGYNPLSARERGMETFRNKTGRDIEAADFEAAELDDMAGRSERFSLDSDGSEDDDPDDNHNRPTAGKASNGYHKDR